MSDEPSDRGLYAQAVDDFECDGENGSNLASENELTDGEAIPSPSGADN